ncbi:MAG: hypothetical protein D6705_01620 [Deltaproteobacteria bacterium]|nr:MAG: hypothetical protein D6705_01620 [Deltaproteobacteria bacterium]
MDDPSALRALRRGWGVLGRPRRIPARPRTVGGGGRDRVDRANGGPGAVVAAVSSGRSSARRPRRFRSQRRRHGGPAPRGGSGRSRRDGGEAARRPTRLVARAVRRPFDPEARPAVTSVDADTLRTFAASVVAVARDLGLDRIAARLEADLERRLGGRRPRVAVVGRARRGKSAVVNALLGREVVPADVVPTTRVPVLVGGDVPPGPHLLGRDGMAEPLAADRYLRLVRGELPAEGRLVVGPLAREEAALEILDTPGLGGGDVSPATVLDEMPSADVLVLVLDATQVFTRSESDLLEAVCEAAGGLGPNGAQLAVVVTRMDLVPEAEREAVRARVREKVGPRLDERALFFVDLAAGPQAPDAEALREGVRRLALARSGDLEGRVASDLDRTAALLEHHLAIQRRALGATPETLAAEIAAIEGARTELARDIDRAREMLAREADAILEAVRADVATFREELETSCRAVVEVASLQTLADRLPGSIHDACLLFLRRRGEELAEELERLSRRVRRTVGDDVARRLGTAHLALSAYGPRVYVDPPSLAIEAGTLAVGIVGTLLMYFGSVATGMTMAVAGPLATVMLREQSVRRARQRVRERLPKALDATAHAIEEVVETAVRRAVADLEEHLVLAGDELADNLLAQLERARQLVEATDGEARKTAVARIEEHARTLSRIRRQLGRAGAAPSGEGEGSDDVGRT